MIVFCQGCPLRCVYCHNPDTWKLVGGGILTVEQVLEQYDRNAAFYARGGITVSGGEPLLQPEFLRDLFQACHEHPQGKIHTCLDTSGGVALRAGNTAAIEAALDACDLVLLDVKHTDPQAYKELCGGSFDHLLAFMELLQAHQVPVRIRQVMVPGITDSVAQVRTLGAFIAGWSNICGLELLPYHTMGVPKYAELGLDYPLAGLADENRSLIPTLRAEVLEAYRQEKRSRG